ncbi:hypothetical protein VARIO8X_90275 [Burkholderiales bacterium 8X]|nr:hypothetical protein VARIO8X_90275 [Burkholderiales bacterium 8X]
MRAWLADEEFSEFCNIPAFRNDLTAVAQWVVPESLDDVGWAVLNDWLLPEAKRKERDAIVELEIANVFGFDGTVVLVGPEPAKLDKIRSIMKTVPDSLLRRDASKMCWSVRGRGRQPGGRGATGYAKTASSDEIVSDAHRSGWSIDRYVEWIEGPIVRKARAATDAAAAAAAEVFNREAQARHEELRRTLVTQSTLSNQAPAPEGVPSMAVSQAEAIIQEALQRAIGFIAGSLDDLIELLTRRGNQTEPDVARYRSDLRRLRGLEASTPIDEVSARAVFAEIWASVEAARASIEAEQSARPPKLSENVYRRFKESLARTLDSERLELDNCTGSDVLIEADPLQFWSRIVRDFHNRRVVLPNSEHVIPPGQERKNALALYVTLGSCTKDVAFCISVHRWRQNRGSNASPSEPDTLAMDEANWTDTFTSCCVLHVKSAALSSGKK